MRIMNGSDANDQLREAPSACSPWNRVYSERQAIPPKCCYTCMHVQLVECPNTSPIILARCFGPAISSVRTVMTKKESCIFVSEKEDCIVIGWSGTKHRDTHTHTLAAYAASGGRVIRGCFQFPG